MHDTTKQFSIRKTASVLHAKPKYDRSKRVEDGKAKLGVYESGQDGDKWQVGADESGQDEGRSPRQADYTRTSSQQADYTRTTPELHQNYVVSLSRGSSFPCKSNLNKNKNKSSTHTPLNRRYADERHP